MKSMYGEPLAYRPIYRNGRFDVIPFGEADYCIVKRDTRGAFAAGRIIHDDNAFAVADIIGSIYQGAITDCSRLLESEFGKAGKEMADKLRAQLCNGMGLPQELSEAETLRVQKEIKS